MDTRIQKSIVTRPCLLLIVLWLSLAAAPAARGNTTLKGVVRDAGTNAVIPEATVQVEGAFQGVVTNAEGVFELTVESLPVTLIVRRIGYTSQRLRIAPGAATIREILLVPAVYDLEPIIVSEPRSAADIMRNVIVRKQQWRARLRAFRAGAYSRFTMANDTSVVFILEGVADVSWDHEHGWKTIVKSYRRTSNLLTDDSLDDPETLDKLAADALILNLYDDNIKIAEHILMGVTNPNALHAYDFAVQGQRLLDDKIVYDIAVKPKNKLFSGFVGRISVLDGDYAMIEADLHPGPAFFFPPPIRGFRVSAKQQFVEFGDGFWLPVGLEMHGDMKVGFVGFVFPDIKARLVSRLANYRVFGTHPDTTVDSLAVPPPLTPPPHRVVQVYVNDSPPGPGDLVIPLTEEERKAYDTVDSTLTFLKAFEPTGFIARQMKKHGVFDEIERREREGDERPSLSGRRRTRHRRRRLAPGPLRYAPEVRYNRVDAAHLGLRTAVSIPRTPLSFTGTGAYNTGTERWDYGGGVTLRWGRNRHALSAFYSKGSETRYRSAVYSPEITSALPLFGEDDYFDYFQNERVTLRARSRLGRRQRLRLTGGLNLERHRSLSKTTDYTLFGIDNRQRPNPAITPGDLRSISVRAEYGRRPRPFSPERSRYLSVDMEFSPSDFLGNDFSFSRYEMRLDWHVRTWFRRRMLPNTLDVRVVGGTSTGTLPPQRFGVLDGSLSVASPFGVFKSLRGQPYEGEHYLGLFWEHNFRTIPFEWLGLTPLVRRGIGLSVYGGHGRTWIADSRLKSLGYAPHHAGKVHHEVGVAITGLLYFFRLDFTQRLDSPDFFVGLGIGPSFVE